MKKSLALLILLNIILSGLAYAKNATIKQSIIKCGLQSKSIVPILITRTKMILSKNDIILITNNRNSSFQEPTRSSNKINFTNNNTDPLVIKNLNALEKEMITYKAEKEKYVITVFTDIACSYCHQFHQQIKNYNALGITVRYVAFPHAGIRSQLEKDMKAIWCAKDRNKALDNAMNGKGIQPQPASCNIDIFNHYLVGIQLGITGTPAIVLNNHHIMMGYQEAKKMKAFLDSHRK